MIPRLLPLAGVLFYVKKIHLICHHVIDVSLLVHGASGYRLNSLSGCRQYPGADSIRGAAPEPWCPGYLWSCLNSVLKVICGGMKLRDSQWGIPASGPGSCEPDRLRWGSVRKKVAQWLLDAVQRVAFERQAAQRWLDRV
jgi:hypothetical protein